MRARIKAVFVALALLAISTPALAANNAANSPARAGGGGGVTSIIAGTGISVNAATGVVTVTNTIASTSLLIANNLSDLNNAGTARTNLGLGSLATQSGTFSGTSSGTNTGDQTITLTGNVTGSGSGSFATTIAAGVVTLAMNASLADQTIMGNGSGGSASPVGLIVSTAGGLAATATTLKTTLSTGLSGGQALYGDTLTTGNITIRPNFANATTGQVVFAAATEMLYDVATHSLRGNTATAANPTYAFINATNTGMYYNGSTAVSISVAGTQAASFTTTTLTVPVSVNFGASDANIQRQSNGIVILSSNAAGFVVAQTLATNRMAILTAGSFDTENCPWMSFSAGSRITPTAGTIMHFGLTPTTQTAAAGTVLDAYKWAAATATFTTAVNITTATGVNFIDIEAPTYTNASASAVTIAATMTIKAAPIAAGSLTITQPLAFWVQGGLSQFDGGISIGNSLATPGSGVIVTTDAPTAAVSLSLKYINMQVGGVTTYVLALQ
jgi:hypothetical protein